MNIIGYIQTDNAEDVADIFQKLQKFEDVAICQKANLVGKIL